MASIPDFRLAKTKIFARHRRSGNIDSSNGHNLSTLARGDRRGYVAVDYRGEIYAIAQYTGVKTKDVAKRLGNAKELPSVEQAKAGIAARMTEALKKRVREVEAGHKTQSAALAFRKANLVERQRKERALLDEQHAKRWAKEEQARAARMSKGFRGIWDRLTGKYAEFRRQNEFETLQALHRDRDEKDALIFSHIEERQLFHKQRNELRAAQARQVEGLHKDIAIYVRMGRDEIVDLPEHFNEANRAIRRLGFTNKMTAHGFRALARTAIREKLGYDSEIIEKQLAHKTSASLGEAYDRTQFLSQRQEMMQAWADYIDEMARTGKVVRLPLKRVV